MISLTNHQQLLNGNERVKKLLEERDSQLKYQYSTTRWVILEAYIML
jgi:hypothetical protein